MQGDRAVKDILQAMGGKISAADGGLLSETSRLHGTVIDAADCPDIIPVLTVAAAVAEGTTKIINAGRLRIKECDRLHAISEELNKLGADIEGKKPEALSFTASRKGCAAEVFPHGTTTA